MHDDRLAGWLAGGRCCTANGRARRQTHLPSCRRRRGSIEAAVSATVSSRYYCSAARPRRPETQTWSAPWQSHSLATTSDGAVDARAPAAPLHIRPLILDLPAPAQQPPLLGARLATPHIWCRPACQPGRI